MRSPIASRSLAPAVPLAAALAALAFAPFAEGAVVLTNLTDVAGTGKLSFSVNSSTGEAVQVTTGAGSGWSVASVAIRVNRLSGSASFQIWSDNGGNLGTLLGTSQVITNSYAEGAKTFAFTVPVSLIGNTSYWFAINGSNSSSTGWQYNANATPTVSGSGWLQGSQLSTTNFTTWTASSGRNYVSLEIDATAVAAGVPDGAATAWLLTPVAALAFLVRRRRATSA
jgi:hypothetical protein